MIENSVSLKEMINENLSDAWILKDRIIFVEDFCHAQYAFEILKDILFISENHVEKVNKRWFHLEFTNKYSMYRIMYRLGFVRIYIYNVDGEEKIVMEHSQYYKPNEFQQRLLNKADQISTMNVYFNKGHENG
jgi:hypothetical protein